VAKVGPKTAAKWLMEYGSLDLLMENAHVGPKIFMLRRGVNRTKNRS